MVGRFWYRDFAGCAFSRKTRSETGTTLAGLFPVVEQMHQAASGFRREQIRRHSRNRPIVLVDLNPRGGRVLLAESGKCVRNKNGRASWRESVMKEDENWVVND